MPLPYRIVTLQVAATLAVASLSSAWNLRVAFAALMAGVVCVPPNAYFAWRVNRERSAGRLLASSVIRFVATVGLMAFVMIRLQPAPAAFFATFVLLQLVHVAGAGRARTGGEPSGRAGTSGARRIEWGPVAEVAGLTGKRGQHGE